MTPQIQTAVSELKTRWPKATVSTNEDENGNVTIIVDPVKLGEQYSPAESWIGFVLQHNHPDPDVYPHFISGDVVRVDGQPLGPAFGFVDWQGRKAIQISRRTNEWNGAIDTAEGKLIKVLEFIQSRS